MNVRQEKHWTYYQPQRTWIFTWDLDEPLNLEWCFEKLVQLGNEAFQRAATFIVITKGTLDIGYGLENRNGRFCKKNLCVFADRIVMKRQAELRVSDSSKEIRRLWEEKIDSAMVRFAKGHELLIMDHKAVYVKMKKALRGQAYSLQKQYGDFVLALTMTWDGTLHYQLTSPKPPKPPKALNAPVPGNVLLACDRVEGGGSLVVDVKGKMPHPGFDGKDGLNGFKGFDGLDGVSYDEIVKERRAWMPATVAGDEQGGFLGTWYDYFWRWRYGEPGNPGMAGGPGGDGGDAGRGSAAGRAVLLGPLAGHPAVHVRNEDGEHGVPGKRGRPGKRGNPGKAGVHREDTFGSETLVSNYKDQTRHFQQLGILYQYGLKPAPDGPRLPEDASSTPGLPGKNWKGKSLLSCASNLDVGVILVFLVRMFVFDPPQAAYPPSLLLPRGLDAEDILTLLLELDALESQALDTEAEPAFLSKEAAVLDRLQEVVSLDHFHGEEHPSQVWVFLLNALISRSAFCRERLNGTATKGNRIVNLPAFTENIVSETVKEAEKIRTSLVKLHKITGYRERIQSNIRAGLEELDTLSGQLNQLKTNSEKQTRSLLMKLAEQRLTLQESINKGVIDLAELKSGLGLSIFLSLLEDVTGIGLNSMNAYTGYQRLKGQRDRIHLDVFPEKSNRQELDWALNRKRMYLQKSEINRAFMDLYPHDPDAAWTRLETELCLKHGHTDNAAVHNLIEKERSLLEEPGSVEDKADLLLQIYRDADPDLGREITEIQLDLQQQAGRQMDREQLETAKNDLKAQADQLKTEQSLSILKNTLEVGIKIAHSVDKTVKLVKNHNKAVKALEDTLAQSRLDLDKLNALEAKSAKFVDDFNDNVLPEFLTLLNAEADQAGGARLIGLLLRVKNGFQDFADDLSSGFKEEWAAPAVRTLQKMARVMEARLAIFQKNQDYQDQQNLAELIYTVSDADMEAWTPRQRQYAERLLIGELKYLSEVEYNAFRLWVFPFGNCLTAKKAPNRRGGQPIAAETFDNALAVIREQNQAILKEIKRNEAQITPNVGRFIIGDDSVFAAARLEGDRALDLLAGGSVEVDLRPDPQEDTTESAVRYIAIYADIQGVREAAAHHKKGDILVTLELYGEGRYYINTRQHTDMYVFPQDSITIAHSPDMIEGDHVVRPSNRSKNVDKFLHNPEFSLRSPFSTVRLSIERKTVPAFVMAAVSDEDRAQLAELLRTTPREAVNVMRDQLLSAGLLVKNAKERIKIESWDLIKRTPLEFCSPRAERLIKRILRDQLLLFRPEDDGLHVTFLGTKAYIIKVNDQEAATIRELYPQQYVKSD